MFLLVFIERFVEVGCSGIGTIYATPKCNVLKNTLNLT